jgi:hypothetical protein
MSILEWVRQSSQPRLGSSQVHWCAHGGSHGATEEEGGCREDPRRKAHHRKERANSLRTQYRSNRRERRLEKGQTWDQAQDVAAGVCLLHLPRQNTPHLATLGAKGGIGEHSLWRPRHCVSFIVVHLARGQGLLDLRDVSRVGEAVTVVSPADLWWVFVAAEIRLANGYDVHQRLDVWGVRCGRRRGRGEWCNLVANRLGHTRGKLAGRVRHARGRH